MPTSSLSRSFCFHTSFSIIFAHVITDIQTEDDATLKSIKLLGLICIIKIATKLIRSRPYQISRAQLHFKIELMHVKTCKFHGSDLPPNLGSIFQAD